MNREFLAGFTNSVAALFDAGSIPGPVHLNSDTQIEPLIEIFRDIKRTDYVLSTWRSTYHALLHGVPPERVLAEIVAGRSMQLHFPEHRFMTSSIMGGMLPIACGLAAGGERVWCFVGDMCASTGAFGDALRYAQGQDLSVKFIIENNGLSTNTPTKRTWGESLNYLVRPLHKQYIYPRMTDHYQPLPGKHGF